MSTKFIDDEYEYLYDEGYGGKTCKKMKSMKTKEEFSKKGHQKKHGTKQDLWDEFLQEREAEEFVFIPPKSKKETKNYVNFSEKNGSKTSKKEEKVTQNSSELKKKEIEWGPNTHEIKGNKIDFDRVDNIEKVENNFNGRNTFGIKFSFSGKKGLSRVVWFNQNARERDAVYNTEYAFWRKNKKNN